MPFRTPEPITITVLRARNLRGVKGDVVNSTVRVEFWEKNLGESPKVECAHNAPAEFNYNTTYNCTFEDPSILDELAGRPVVLTLTEFLPKEKKQKEEKSQQLGQCTFALLPLIRGETKHQYTLQVHSFPGSPLEQLPVEAPVPEVDVAISVENPLINEALQKESNVISVSVESLYSPPEAFSVGGPTGVYTAAMPLPFSADREVPLVFAGGSVKPGADKEPHSKQKKWAICGSGQGNAVYIPDSFVATDAVDDEDGDLRAREDREHRQISELEKNRVVWNTERRNYLQLSAMKSLKDKIAKTRVWPVEVFRISGAGGAKGKKDEDGGIGFHGIAYVNFSPLLYPGVKRIRGAYKVHPFLDNEYQEKTKRKYGIADEAARIAYGIINRSTASPTGKKGAADKAPEKKEKGGDKKGAKGDAGSDTAEVPVNVEGQQYADQKAYVMIEIALDRPLVPKKTPEEVNQHVAAYIPQRPLFPKRTNAAEKAVEDYHCQIAEISTRVLDEFREMFSEQIRSGEIPSTPEAVEQMRQELMYELNSSGKYFAFKEQLKYAVIKIVREKYLKTNTFADQEQLQLFLRDLFVYLVDELQTGLGRVITLEEKTPVPPPVTDSEQLLHFAREAEVNENHIWASRYYQERIARDRNRPNHWFDYGTYSLAVDDVAKAEECFRECIAIDQKDINGLILYGLVCALQERHEEAETFLEAATTHDPNNVVAWTILSLFYDAVGNDIGAEMALMEANKLNEAEAAGTIQSQRDTCDLGATAPGTELGQPLLHPDSTQLPPLDTQSEAVHSKLSEKAATPAPAEEHTPGTADDRPKKMSAPEPPVVVPPQTVFMRTSLYLLSMKAYSFAERAVAHELVSGQGPTPKYSLVHARLKLAQREFEVAEQSLAETLAVDYENSEVWAQLGHLKYLVGDVDAAKDCYERTLAFEAPPSDLHPILLRLASIYLQEQRFQDAKNTFLVACKRSPSCVSWLGVGIASYRLDELTEAEDALSEANILNNRDPEVWGYLSLLCLVTGRKVEAEQAYKYALKVGLEDKALLDELKDTQTKVGFGDPQFS